MLRIEMDASTAHFIPKIFTEADGHEGPL